MAKLTSLLDHANRQRMVVPQNPTTDIAAIVMAGQTAMAEVITRNFSGEISDKVKAEMAACMGEMCSRVEASVMSRVDQKIRDAISAMPIPERVIERITEREEPEEEEDEPQTVTVQRKDGMIAGVKVGKTAYDVVRNKQGLIKEVVPRG